MRLVVQLFYGLTVLGYVERYRTSTGMASLSQLPRMHSGAYLFTQENGRLL